MILAQMPGSEIKPATRAEESATPVQSYTTALIERSLVKSWRACIDLTDPVFDRMTTE